MATEQVIGAMDRSLDSGRVVEVEKPDSLRMSTINNMGLDVTRVLLGLGFNPGLEIRQGWMLFFPPDQILDRDWFVSRQTDEEGRVEDPNLFTMYLRHPGVGNFEFMRQIATHKGYRIFFP